MRIVIDLQGAQGASSYRGIGRYSLSLTLAIAQHASNHEIWLILNAAFPESILKIRRLFSSLIPQDKIRIFDIPGAVAECDPVNKWRTCAGEKIREYFIQQLQPDIVLLTSLFEGYIDNTVTSIGSLNNEIPVAVILYDLIPLLNQKTYLPSAIQKDYYNRKIKSLKNAALLLAISDCSGQDATKNLQIPPENIINISGAVTGSFTKKYFSPQQKNDFLKPFGINRKFILYVPGGFDARKNFEGLIKAYHLLPTTLRADYQLVITSKITHTEQHYINSICKQIGLSNDEVILTNYLSDDDLIMMYNLTSLFVFPSKYEGFGLPILEAMTCGAPVIGANNSSIPEIIGCNAALFDTDSTLSMSDKIKHVLQDKEFRLKLQQHSIKQAKLFSWEESARRIISALETRLETITRSKAQLTQKHQLLNSKKPRLAFISPLPPERTGIADYCAELLPELLHHYDIELITDQANEVLPSPLLTLPRHPLSWFLANGHLYDRIIYQFGNSPFHSHMLALLSQYPGVVILHDFFLSSMLAYEERSNLPGVWTKALYHSHGYAAVKMRHDPNHIELAKDQYPANLEVLQNANGIIVHSIFSKKLATQWYGENAANTWKVIPQLYDSNLVCNRIASRQALKINENSFVVCSFGFIASTKLNHRLLTAWLSSPLHLEKNCELIFIGENEGSNYGAELSARIRDSRCNNRIRITGWVDKTVYEKYLQAADVAVQLRSLSRGETSRASLECMSYGLATIMNANGPMAELPNDAVWMLNDEFTDDELIDALQVLWQNTDTRKKLASRAREVIATKHHPTLCANLYAEAIESIYQTEDNHHALLNAVAASNELPTDTLGFVQIAQTIANSCKPKPSLKQLLIDISNITKNDLKTGIERVVRAQLIELINNPPEGFRVEPIYLSCVNNSCHYQYARQFTFKFLGINPLAQIPDTPIDIHSGDIVYIPAYSPFEFMQASHAGIFSRWQVLGAKINILVYDLLPVLRPEFFPEGNDQIHGDWLAEVAKYADCLIGISATVADQLYQWLDKKQPLRSDPLRIAAAPLGADISSSAPTTGLPKTGIKFLEKLKKKTAFLMVGTIEPRKGHLQTLAAFEELWQQGHQITLVIVGKEGWKFLPKSKQRTIPCIIEKISRHPELNKRLFWLDEVSDEYLQKIYASCVCLIAASEGEGFGLPLIEAAQYKLPIIARDLPVFQEVAGKHAFYFSGYQGHDLATAISEWLILQSKHEIPLSTSIQWNTWAENANILISTLLEHRAEKIWTPLNLL